MTTKARTLQTKQEQMKHIQEEKRLRQAETCMLKWWVQCCLCHTPCSSCSYSHPCPRPARFSWPAWTQATTRHVFERLCFLSMRSKSELVAGLALPSPELASLAFAPLLSPACSCLSCSIASISRIHRYPYGMKRCPRTVKKRFVVRNGAAMWTTAMEKES